MRVGAVVRRAFGPYEKQVSELWRSMFLDLADWTATLQRWQPAPRRILELGCGEGYSTELLVAAFPDAQIDAIDIAGNLGRLYGGPAGRVHFRQIYAEELADEAPGAFDLVILSDVLHHVPASARPSLLRAIAQLTAPGGTLAFKDWRRDYTPIYWMAWGADRFLTGDKVVFPTPTEARALMEQAYGKGCVTAEATIAPWSNNFAFRIDPAGAPAPAA